MAAKLCRTCIAISLVDGICNGRRIEEIKTADSDAFLKALFENQKGGQRHLFQFAKLLADDLFR